MATIKRGDVGDTVTMTVNMDLSSGSPTVRLLARAKLDAAADVIELDAVITDAAEGIVTHTTDGLLPYIPGGYDIELEVTRGTEIFTFPTNGFVTLTIVPDLG